MIRLRPEEFAHILNLIKNDEVFHRIGERLQLRIDLQLKIVLYCLGSSGNGACVRKVASVFGIGDGSTIQNIRNRVIKAILNLKEHFLYWPNEEERTQLVLASRNKLSGCIGCIDGSEIRLAETPYYNHELYFSRKRQYALKIQAVCDHNLSVRQLTVGYPGSVHDAKIFFRCPFAKQPHRYLSRGQWIAGDSAYPLRPFLITSFRTLNTQRRNGKIQ